MSVAHATESETRARRASSQPGSFRSISRGRAGAVRRRASLPASGRRRPFPAGAGVGIEHRDEHPEPESTRRRAPGREKRPLSPVEECSGVVPLSTLAGDTDTGPRLVPDGQERACPVSGLRTKHPARERRTQGRGPGAPHGSAHIPVALVRGLARDAEQVGNSLPRESLALLRIGDRVL